MAEFAQRPMVTQGLPPSAPDAVGTGITSGLVPENNDPIIQQGLEQFASSVEGLYGKLDQSETFEDVINSIRGNEMPKKERVAELAEMVGEKDAKKTPDSVLAVMQPYFQILEMVQSQASDVAPGGIANAPMAGGGQPNVNFNQASPIQAPGAEEAMMRMAMGETPVGFSHGGYHRITPGMPSRMDTPFPKYTSPDYDKFVVPQAEAFMEIQKQLGYEQLPTDVASIMENQNKYLDEFKIEPRSKEEILAEQTGFFGNQDQRDMETQGSLALAKFGAGIANTGGSLLQALTGNTSQLAGDLSKVAAQKAALDRQQKEFAYSVAAKEKTEERSTNLSLALDAVKTAAANGTSNTAQTNAAIKMAMEFGIDNAKDAAALVNKQRSEGFNAAMLFAGKTEVIYGGINPVTNKYESFRSQMGREGQGPMAIDKIDPLKLNALPDWARPQTAASNLANTQSGQTDWSKAQKTTFTIPSKTSGDGWEQVQGVFVPDSGYYLTPDGNYTTAVRPPPGSIVGDKASIITVGQADGAGRILTTVTPPNGESFTQLTGIKARNPETGEITSEVIPISARAYSLEPFTTKTNEATGEREIVSNGNPLVFERPTSGVRPIDLASKDMTSRARRVVAIVNTLDAGQELLGTLKNVIGPIATLKGFSTNRLASFIPEGRMADYLTWFKSSEGQKALTLFERTVQKSDIVSDRFAIGEQAIVAETVPKFEFSKNPEAALVQFQEYLRQKQNQLSNERHSLDPDNVPRYALDRVPTGGERDPFMFFDETLPAGATSHFDYLTKIASDNTMPADLTGVFVNITGAQLEYIMRDSTQEGKESAYLNSDGSLKENILVDASRMIQLTGQ